MSEKPFSDKQHSVERLQPSEIGEMAFQRQLFEDPIAALQSIREEYEKKSETARTADFALLGAMSMVINTLSENTYNFNSNLPDVVSEVVHSEEKNRTSSESAIRLYKVIGVDKQHLREWFIKEFELAAQADPALRMQLIRDLTHTISLIEDTFGENNEDHYILDKEEFLRNPIESISEYHAHVRDGLLAERPILRTIAIEIEMFVAEAKTKLTTAVDNEELQTLLEHGLDDSRGLAALFGLFHKADVPEIDVEDWLKNKSEGDMSLKEQVALKEQLAVLENVYGNK